tara:strand:+ start:1005 stop:1145 length:141 start_codon:yes stop_codon:yes gene_type:complete
MYPLEKIVEYYTYINNSKEFFTSNIDLAWKRSDEGTEPETIIYERN